MRRSPLLPVACFVVLGMVVAGWSGGRTTTATPSGESRVVASMADVQAVPATTPRPADAAILPFALGLALTGATFLRRSQTALPTPRLRRAHSISLRGPPQLAAR